MKVMRQPDLKLDRCPHCGIAKPRLNYTDRVQTASHANADHREWCFYVCSHCGGVVMTMAPLLRVATSRDTMYAAHINGMWPSVDSAPEEPPDRAKHFLQQAMDSLHAASASIMCSASAVDAMLKDKGLTKGNLFDRIEDAAKQHLITDEMKAWAHEIRLDANDQRHADEAAPIPSDADARKAIEFAKALAQFLYVLPARVARGRGVAAKAPKP